MYVLIGMIFMPNLYITCTKYIQLHGDQDRVVIFIYFLVSDILGVYLAFGPIIKYCPFVARHA